MSLHRQAMFGRRRYGATMWSGGWSRGLRVGSCLRAQFREAPRINQVGVQYLSENLQQKLFPTTGATDYLKPRNPALLDLAKAHLKYNELLGKKTEIIEPITIDDFPGLEGCSTLDEHFYRIGTEAAQPYLSMAEEFMAPGKQLPPRPKPSEWLFEAGWVRYAEGEDPQSVPHPQEDALVFDVEVIYQKSPYAVLCTCASSKAWYGWVSPFLVNYAENKKYDDWEHLIPFNCLSNPKLLIGYNVSYDRARVLDEYNIKQSNGFYLDGMSLHVAISGICSQQRPTWHKHKKSKKLLDSEDESPVPDNDVDYFDKKLSAVDVANELLDDPWLNKGSPNSLANVADFHCNIKLDKSDRDYFSTTDPTDVINNFNNLMDYCAKDVEATYAVTAKLFPQFRQKVPHPVSFAALRHLGSLMLPTTKKWNKYIETAEKVYQENREQVSNILRERANDFVTYIEENDESLKPNWEDDPWLSQLNWTLKEKRLKKNGDPVANQAFLTGYPEWYRELFKTTTTDGVKHREMNITVRTRITPLLLKLKWEGYPLLWTNSAGWCFKVPFDESIIQAMEDKSYTRAKLNNEDLEVFLPQLRDNGNNYELFKIPHPEGPSKRCTSILSKNYLRYFENNVLTSEYSFAQEILTLNSTASYWMGNRQRIMDQFVVYSDSTHKKNKFFGTKKESKQNNDMAIILPKLCSMGTITRRATENTWLTASNSKRNRIGSELKAMIEAPNGYVFVGADVDSEELWIASLVGDSMFGIHGATALGWMTLEGDKNEKTDLHSKTAEILGISRNDAKVFNYGRIYGAGVKFATRLLKQCNSSLSDEEAELMAKTLYSKTKGQTNTSKFLERRMYHGGTESIMFNALESIAYQEDPKTPVLGAAITDALTISNLNKNNYLTSRINWVIQSSGVDYLHLLIVSMEFLAKKFAVDARLVLTVHDELRYLVKKEDQYKAALILQISNLWTRAMFCEQLGIKEVPQSCAFFSEIDIDHVLRKEVTLDCVTPSHANEIPPAESFNIHKILEKCKNEDFLNISQSKSKRSPKIKYPGRDPVILSLEQELNNDLRISRLKLQNSIDKTSWRQNMNDYIRLKKDVEFNKFHGEFDRRNIIFGQTSENGRKGDNMFSSKVPRRRRVVDEYDIGSNGDEMLAREIGIADEQKDNYSPKSAKDKPKAKPRRTEYKWKDTKSQPKKLTSTNTTSNSNSSSKTTRSSANGKDVKKTNSSDTGHKSKERKIMPVAMKHAKTTADKPKPHATASGNTKTPAKMASRQNHSRLTKLFFKNVPSNPVSDKPVLRDTSNGSTCDKHGRRSFRYYDARADYKRQFPIQQPKDPPAGSTPSADAKRPQNFTSFDYTQEHFYNRATHTKQPYSAAPKI